MSDLVYDVIDLHILSRCTPGFLKKILIICKFSQTRRYLLLVTKCEVGVKPFLDFQFKITVLLFPQISK